MIRDGGLDHPAVIALLHQHRTLAHADRPAELAFALDADALRDPAISFHTAWDGDALLGMAALRHLDARHGEVKSMRVTDAAKRRGVGRALLAHLVALARARGYGRLSLETGTAPRYVPAIALYAAAGFVDAPPFADYAVSPHNRFMTLAL